MNSHISDSLATISRAEKSTQHPEFLCKQCETLRLNRWLAPRSVRFLYQLPDKLEFDLPLAVSPSSCCALCRLFAHSLGQAGTITELQFQDYGDTQTLEGHITQSISMHISGDACRDVGLRIMPLGQSAFRLSSRCHNYARILEPEAASRKLIQEWLKECEHSHNRCQELEEKVQHLPMRCSYLIDVKEMRIRDVAGRPRRYFALSYVWGQVANLQLLKKNIIELSEPQALCSRFESLPRVIQDAITITQELGETFLWVDSLCICQDDATNKHFQIANMARIYQSAVATLIALDAKNAAGGLPGVRPYHEPRIQYIERVQHMRMTTLLPDLQDRQSAYSTRAWTYQEELFSRRLLYFANGQVHFRCLKSTYSEDTYGDDPGFPYGRTGQLYGLYPYTKFSWWQKAVTEYSARAHSFVEDRLNAFEGISTELAESWQYPCIGGLPIHDLAAALCWEHRFQSSHEVSTRISLHPSWSWCGWTNNIGFCEIDLLIKILVLQADDGNSHYYWKCRNHHLWSECHDQLVENYPYLNRCKFREDAHIVMTSATSNEIRTPYASRNANSPGFSRHKSLPQPLVLKVFAYSVFLEVAVINEGFRSQFHVVPQPSFEDTYDFIPLPNEWKTPANPHIATTIRIECILIAISGRQTLASTAHIMLIEPKGEHYERIGIGKISERCFWSLNVVQRFISLR